MTAPPPSPPVSRLAPSGLEAPVLFWHFVAIAVSLVPTLFFGFAVAPAAFRILPTRDMAANLTGSILTKACWLAEGGFAVLFVTSWLLGRWWSAPRLSRSLWTRAAILGVITSTVIEKLLIPPMDKIRREAPGLIDDLPVADPSRILLDRYHRLSTAFFAADIAAALLILVVTVRLIAHHQRAAPAPAAVQPPLPKLLDLSDV